MRLHRPFACQEPVPGQACPLTGASQFPAETHYRTCDGLLQLQRTTDSVIFKTACDTAIRLQRYSLSFIRQMVESKCAGVLTEDLPLFAPPEHANIRGKEQFK